MTEIKRNFFSDEALPKKYTGYYGHAAHNRAHGRRSSMRKLLRYPSVCALVIQRLKDGWTPEQIAYRMLYEKAPLRVCQETIYRYIYSKEGMEQELWWYLPMHRKSRTPRRSRKKMISKFHRDVSIVFRPDDG